MKKVVLFMGIVVVGVLNFLGSTKKLDIYNLIRDNYEIVEQGVKVQYLDNDMDKSYLKNTLNLTDDFQMYNDNFYYLEENKNFFIEIKGIEGFVEIEIKNFDNSINVKEMESKIKEKLYKNKDLKTFTYVKGKGNDIYSLEKASNYVEKNFRKNYEKVTLSNGETGVIKFDKNTEYNYSLVSYGKDDNYIIVGSPVIFITY